RRRPVARLLPYTTLFRSLDLRNRKDSARLVAKLDTAFLQELNLIDTETFVSGNIELDTRGITLDEIEGSARFRDVQVVHEGRELDRKSTRLNSSHVKSSY